MTIFFTISNRKNIFLDDKTYSLLAKFDLFVYRFVFTMNKGKQTESICSNAWKFIRNIPFSSSSTLQPPCVYQTANIYGTYNAIVHKSFCNNNNGCRRWHCTIKYIYKSEKSVRAHEAHVVRFPIFIVLLTFFNRAPPPLSRFYCVSLARYTQRNVRFMHAGKKKSSSYIWKRT